MLASGINPISQRAKCYIFRDLYSISSVPLTVVFGNFKVKECFQTEIGGGERRSLTFCGTLTIVFI